MDKLAKVIEIIIERKSGIVPAYIYDKFGILKDAIKEIKDAVDITILDSRSVITLQNCINNFSQNKHHAIYSTADINIDGFLASNKLCLVEITPQLLLSFCDEVNPKLKGNIDLTDEQYKLFANNFDLVLSDLKTINTVTNEIIKSSLARVFLGRNCTPKDLLVAFIKGEFSLEQIAKLALFDQITRMIKTNLNIDITKIICNEDLVAKIFISMLCAENANNIHAEYNDKILKLEYRDLSNLYEFIKMNNGLFEQEIALINKDFIGKSISYITYLIPQLFENYIVDNIEKYNEIIVNEDLLWTKSMKNIGLFIRSISNLESLLMQYVSHTFYTNDISAVIQEYKNTLYIIDTVYRELLALYEELSYDYYFYSKVNSLNIMDNLTAKYFNVISNINGKYISGYKNLLIAHPQVLRQDEVLKKVKFRNNTVFVFADGLRYELAQKLIEGIDCVAVQNIDVISLLPTETEVCMNGYFITDEKLRLNSKNVFELIRQDKVITQILKWRTEKLAKILECNVITFDDFKETIHYNNSVICFYNDVDIALHSFDSAKKVSMAKDELREILNYSLGRGFDVMLLSDHGFIDINRKIVVQDKEIDTEKKKGRYLILPSDEKADTMYYENDLSVAGFIEMAGKSMCFINSINSLKQTSRYTHGGISLQETIITAMLLIAK